MKSVLILVQFTMTLSLLSQSKNSGPLRKNEDLEFAKVLIQRIAIENGDTTSLNKLIRKYRNKNELSISSLIFSINYLQCSEDIKHDSVRTRIKSHNPENLFAQENEDFELQVIKKNSLLLALKELGLYWQGSKGFSSFTTWIEKTIALAKIQNGDSILISGPSNSLGVIPIALSLMYPDSKINVLLPNDVIKNTVKNHFIKFRDQLDISKIQLHNVETLKSNPIPLFDKVIIYHNLYNYEELNQTISITKNNTHKDSELIYFEEIQDFENKYGCTGFISPKEIKKLFKRHKLKELEDKSFQGTISSYVLKAYEKQR